MKDTFIGKGKCLCGSVKVTANTAHKLVGACHCGMCRKWGGAPYLALNCDSDVTFQGEEFVKSYNSSSWAERGFCSNCGTHLFFKLKSNNQYFLTAGILDNQRGLVFERELFVEEKPNFYCFSNDTKKYTGKQLLEMYAEKHQIN